MRMYDIISSKKAGNALTDEEIKYVVKNYTAGLIPDYQMSALTMAICFNSMNDHETSVLTYEMANSGDTVDLSRFGNLSVDKHSTGGVGDKTTIAVAPIAASLGCYTAKMTGRGLGHTGGTIDKLESIPGYNITLGTEEFLDQVERIGISVIGQSGEFAPADKKLYALRDVTATVDSVPLIASSIMSKKLAAGAHNIVLDVKTGSGAFMKNVDDAKFLAQKMVSIGKACGRNVSALITNMDMPLGYAVGNNLEVIEALETLKGNGPEDFTELVIEISSKMVSLAKCIERNEALNLVKDSISSGKAFDKLIEWIDTQGGNTAYIKYPTLFPKAKTIYQVKAPKNGYISYMNAELIGNASVVLGAGREKKEDTIDHSAGIIISHKTGDYVSEGETIATLYTSSDSKALDGEKLYLDSVRIDDNSSEKLKTILDTVE